MVAKGSPEACQLAGRLSQHKCKLTLSNGLAIGQKWDCPRNAWGQWDYIDLGVGEGASNSMEVHLNEEGFIVWSIEVHGLVVSRLSKHTAGLRGSPMPDSNTFYAMMSGDVPGHAFMYQSRLPLLLSSNAESVPPRDPVERPAPRSHVRACGCRRMGEAASIRARDIRARAHTAGSAECGGQDNGLRHAHSQRGVYSH